jgi:hypothetical protein
LMSHVKYRGNQKTHWLGNIAAWLSGVSMLVYFFSSYTVKNYFIFLAKNFNKAVAILLR